MKAIARDPRLRRDDVSKLIPIDSVGALTLPNNAPTYGNIIPARARTAVRSAGVICPLPFRSY